MKEDLFDRFLTFLSKIIRPKQNLSSSSPVFVPSTTQEFIESKDTIVLQEEVDIEPIETARFNESRFNESKLS